MLCLDAWCSGMFGLGWYKFSCVALSCCTPSCLAIFLDIWLINPKNSLNPLFKAILYALSWVMKLVNRNLWTERQGTQNHAQQKNKAHKTTTNNRRRKKHTKPPRTTEKQGTQNHHEQQENKAHKTTLNNRKARHTKPPWTTEEKKGTQNHHEQQENKVGFQHPVNLAWVPQDDNGNNIKINKWWLTGNSSFQNQSTTKVT